MKRSLIWLALAMCAALALVVASGRTSIQNDNELADAIGSELRCPVCQGLSIADSDSATALNLRADIARRIDAGETRSEIIDAYVARYGDWIRLRPRRSGVASLVWAIPPVLTAAAATMIAIALWRWRKRPRRSATAADRALVAEALEQRSHTALEAAAADATP
ncbi:MAG: cytochrome c-type biogenesis protein CcmH [Ilumatobacter sp.]